MGMNIYRLNGEHIGKRFAGGVWCWDCKVEVINDDATKTYACPKCGHTIAYGQLAFNPAMRELGFDKSEEHEHTGIDGASGFTWHGKNRADALHRIARIRKVKTEYGEIWTIDRFRRMFKDVIVEKYVDGEFC